MMLSLGILLPFYIWFIYHPLAHLEFGYGSVVKKTGFPNGLYDATQLTFAGLEVITSTSLIVAIRAVLTSVYCHHIKP
jgi:hypothetical protein